MKHSQISAGAIDLHVVEQGSGPPVLFVHGFPDTWRGWRRQIEAVAAAGFRAIALDMRGYGRSTGPDDPLAYTPFHTVADLVTVLDTLDLPKAILVGHDFGASIVWAAAMMRPDRVAAVFGVSVPFMAPGDRSFLDDIRAAGVPFFYMFDQMEPQSDEKWADASTSYPGFLYWSSGTPAPEDRWDPFDGTRAMYRKAPLPVPPWADPEDVAATIADFQRNGFHRPLNYYRSIPLYFELARAFKGRVITQPSYFLTGELDGVNKMRQITADDLRPSLPGLLGMRTLPGAGHWPQQEDAERFIETLLEFLRSAEVGKEIGS